MKLKKRDIAFSQLVRMRANWTCERCGKHYGEGRRQGLDCSHFFGRSRRSVRFHPLNAASHCRGCHSYLGANPIEFREWIKKYLGEPKYTVLVHLANARMRFSKAILEDVYQHLKSELMRMTKLRKDGFAGRIGFDPPFLEEYD